MNGALPNEISISDFDDNPAILRRHGRALLIQCRGHHTRHIGAVVDQFRVIDTQHQAVRAPVSADDVRGHDLAAHPGTSLEFARLLSADLEKKQGRRGVRKFRLLGATQRFSVHRQFDLRGVAGDIDFAPAVVPPGTENFYHGHVNQRAGLAGNGVGVELLGQSEDVVGAMVRGDGWGKNG